MFVHQVSGVILAVSCPRIRLASSYMPLTAVTHRSDEPIRRGGQPAHARPSLERRRRRWKLNRRWWGCSVRATSPTGDSGCASPVSMGTSGDDCASATGPPQRAKAAAMQTMRPVRPTKNAMLSWLAGCVPRNIEGECAVDAAGHVTYAVTVVAQLRHDGGTPLSRRGNGSHARGIRGTRSRTSRIRRSACDCESRADRGTRHAPSGDAGPGALPPPALQS